MRKRSIDLIKSNTEQKKKNNKYVYDYVIMILYA